MSRSHVWKTVSWLCNAKKFPERTFMVLGLMHIGLGVFLLVLCIVGITLDLEAMKQDCDNFIRMKRYRLGYDWYMQCWGQHDYYPQVLAFDLTCLAFSCLYAWIGFLSLCISRKRKKSCGGLIEGFMVSSIFGTLTFVPIILSLGGFGLLKRGESDIQVDVSSVGHAVLSVVKIVMSIVALTYSCFCTPWKKDKSERVICVRHLPADMYYVHS